MTFRIALSGLNAASSDLGVTANNIANVSTPGFKRSRAEFADVFASGSSGSSSTTIGNGVRVSRVAQLHQPGNINSTGNSLDLAISGEGFFTMNDNGNLLYTRAGMFNIDADGYVVNAQGQNLQAYPPLAAGGFDTGRMQDLQLSLSNSAPSATSSVTVGTTLPGGASVPAVTPFAATDPRTYNHTTSVTVYDSLGISHVHTMYFVKTATANQWNVHSFVDGTAVGGAQTLTYDSAGVLTTPATGTITLPAYTPTTGAANMTITMDFSESTQYGERFSVNELTQNGYTIGRLAGLGVSQEGVVQARYTNGQIEELGQLALGNFANPMGLQPVGNTEWAETFASGQVLRGAAGSGSFGAIQAGSLEASNVDMTEQLVNMIAAQRNFQANAQVISTADQVAQTIINLR